MTRLRFPVAMEDQRWSGQHIEVRWLVRGWQTPFARVIYIADWPRKNTLGLPFINTAMYAKCP